MKLIIAIIIIITALAVIIFKKSFSKTKDNNDTVKIDNNQTIKQFIKAPLVFEGEPNKILSDVLNKASEDIQIFSELKSYAEGMSVLARDLQLPLLVMIMGEFKTGKSTFINTLLGEDCLKSDVTPATAVVTMLKYGEDNELIAHFQDGSSKEYSIEKLEVLSAEGDPEGEEIRSRISYLEMSIPNPVLKNITIVDTPGLNSDKPLHTIATKEFMNRADLVLWIFSYAKSGSRTEMATIKSLGDNLKPICIVNRIDEIDPEEEDVDEILDDLRKRIGNAVGNIVGVSAFEAREAQKNNDADRLKLSRWKEFQNIFNAELLGKCEYKKLNISLVRLKDCIIKLNLTMDSQEKVYKEAFDIVNNTTATIQKFYERKVYFKKLVVDWTPKEDEVCLEEILVLAELPSDIETYERLNLQKNRIEGVSNALAEEVDRFDVDRSELDTNIDYYNEEFERLMCDYNKFIKSGLFGGIPVFDFKGDRKRIKDWKAKLDSKAQVLELQEEVINSRKTELIGRFHRSEQETKDFWTNVRNNINNSIEVLENKLNNIERERISAKTEVDRLKWVVDARNVMDKSVAINLNKGLDYIEQRIGVDQSFTPISIDGAIHKIDELVRKLSLKMNESNYENVIIQEETNLAPVNIQLDLYESDTPLAIISEISI